MLPPVSLAFAPGNHKAGASDDEDNTDCRRHFLVVVSGDADVEIACAYAVVLGVREGYEEGKNSQHEHHRTYDQ